MHAMTPVGMPGTTMTEGRGRKGKGVSEPSRTSGFQCGTTACAVECAAFAVDAPAAAAYGEAGPTAPGAASVADASGTVSFARICSAKNNVGPMPAPSPINNRRGLLATRPYDVCEHGHPDGHPIAHLIANHRLLTVRNVGCDLDPAIHRLRMHHDGIRACEHEPLR
jgi:hypothetical protein